MAKTISANYCKLQNLLRYQERTAYSSGRLGWNYDIYHIGDAAVICTGYRGMPGRQGKDAAEYELRAKAILSSDLPEEEKKTAVNNLLQEFIAQA